MATKDLVDAVIVAAGQSVRYGSNKLLEDLCGRPVIVRTIDAIAKAPSVAQIIIVVAPDQSMGGAARMPRTAAPSRFCTFRSFFLLI